MTYNSFREALTETEKEITEKINSDRKFHIMGIKARYIYAKKLKKITFKTTPKNYNRCGTENDNN